MPLRPLDSPSRQGRHRGSGDILRVGYARVVPALAEEEKPLHWSLGAGDEVKRQIAVIPQLDVLTSVQEGRQRLPIKSILEADRGLQSRLDQVIGPLVKPGLPESLEITLQTRWEVPEVAPMNYI